MAATINTIVKSYLGDDMNVSLVSSYEDLIRNGFNFIADLIPADSQLWNNVNIQGGATATGAASTFDVNIIATTRKILSVQRTHTGDVARPAKEISYEDFLRGADSTSIFYHGHSYTLPVYTYTPNGTIQISPAIGANDTWTYNYFEYITADVSALTPAAMFDSGDEEYKGRGFPREAFLAACIKASINLIQARISDAAQDDEDMELLQILQTQAASLEKLLQAELTVLQVPYKIIGVEDDTQ